MHSKQQVIDWIEDNRTPFIEMAQAIWQRPELAFYEFFAAQLQADFLEEHGFRVVRDVAGLNTAFIAEWGEGGPILGFAGEYDALPGLSQKCQTSPEPVEAGGAGHGCGHNLLGTAHVAAAVAVKKWLEANRVSGTVRYYGCPAEEVGAAKTFMARAGLYDDLDAAFNFHPMYANMAMKGSLVGVYSFRLRFHGTAAHAGAAPHLGRSALDAVELTHVGINYLREHVPGDVRMHYIITHGGDAANVVPAQAEALYMIRAHQPDTLRAVVARVRDIAQGAALMTGTRVEEIFVAALSNVLNNHALADLQYANMEVIGPLAWSPEELDFAAQINAHYPAGTAQGNGAAFGLPTSLFTAPLLGENYPSLDADKLVTGSTDVGDLSWCAPLSMLTTACWTTASVAHSWGVVATGGMSIGHKGMLHAAKIMALTALDLYREPAHLQQIRAEFDEQRRTRPYINPLPPQAQPPRFSPA
ncbi:MAG: amidohydrolase [Caldilineales bacterium]